MEYKPLDEIPYYTECSKLVDGLGYTLVELRIVPAKTQQQVRAVITHKDASVQEGIGIADCSKVHKLLLPRLEALLKSQEIYMEVTSPGMERTIKNAAELALFTGRLIRVWNTEIKDWIPGKIISSDTEHVTLDAAEKGEITLPYGQIAKIKLLQL